MSVQKIESALVHLSRDERKQVRARLDWIDAEAQERQPGESREERRDRQLAAMIGKGRQEFGPRAGQRRPFGLAAGEFAVPDDFDAPLSEEVLRLFEDGPIFPSEPTR